jgi:hypothetical protein
MAGLATGFEQIPVGALLIVPFHEKKTKLTPAGSGIFLLMSLVSGH